MKKVYIGIDNGVSGTIGFVSESEYWTIKTPIVKVQDYTKTKKMISRIDSVELVKELSIECDSIFAFVERPMINPTRFNASISAARSLEATITILETLNIPYQFIDSKEWQKALLPSGCKGEDLKIASKTVGKRLFPNVDLKHTDYDGLLIAEYAKRMNY